MGSRAEGGFKLERRESKLQIWGNHKGFIPEFDNLKKVVGSPSPRSATSALLMEVDRFTMINTAWEGCEFR